MTSVSSPRFRRPVSFTPRGGGWRFLVIASFVMGSVAMSLALASPASAVNDTPPPAGAVTAGTYGVDSTSSLTCNSVMYGPADRDGPAITLFSAFTARCYGPPLGSGVHVQDFSVSYYVRDGATTAPMTVFEHNCDILNEGAMSLGRYEFTCWGENSVPSRDVVKGPGADPGAGYGSNYYVPIQINLSTGAYLRTSNAGFQSGALWRSIAVWEQTMVHSPTWPQWWPSAATPTIPEDANGAYAPRIACQATLRKDADGVVRANFTYELNDLDDPDPPGWEGEVWATDSTPQWGFQWEGPTTGEPSSTSWWESRTDTHSGAQIRDVEVPTTGVPSGGWRVAVRIRRTITESDALFGILPEYGSENVPGGPVRDDDGDGWFMPVGFMSHFGIEGGIPALGWWPDSNQGYFVPEDPVGGTLPTAWETIDAICTTRVDPPKVGSPGGAGGGSVAPTGQPPGPVTPPPGSGGGGGGGGGCDIPDGWSMLNPFSWMGTVGCVLGPLWDLIQQIIDLIGDAIGFLGEIVDFLVGLPGWLVEQLVPEESFGDRFDRIGAAFSDSAPAELATGIGEAGTGIGGALQGAESSGTCTGPTATFNILSNSYEFRPLESCEGPMLPVRVWFRTLMSALIVLDGGRRVFQLLARPFGIGTPDGGGES